MNKVDELRIINNFLSCMTKIYRKRTLNYVVVQDILMNGTSTAGRTSCIAKCDELGIDPFGKNLMEEK
jgi:hypothetical protein